MSRVLSARPRSHLAKNNVLVALGRSFGNSTFSSREASARLGLDFLYTSKVLWRLRKAYLLRLVLSTPRFWGGYENLYQVSVKGWKRIIYIQEHDGVTIDESAPL
jgi:hypothetical protein